MIALLLALICLGLPSLMLGWFLWEDYRVGREIDKENEE